MIHIARKPCQEEKFLYTIKKNHRKFCGTNNTIAL